MKKKFCFSILVSLLLSCSNGNSGNNQAGLALVATQSSSSSSDSSSSGNNGGSISADAKALMNNWSSLSDAWKNAIIYNADDSYSISIDFKSGPTSSQADKVVSMSGFDWITKDSSSQQVTGTDKITTLEPFKYFKKLSSISLLGNNISSIPVDIFKYNTELISLHITHDKIADIYKGSFNGLSKVSSLSFTMNKIKNLPAQVFTNLPNLTYLYLTANQIQSDDISDTAFENLDNLTTLNIGYQNHPHTTYLLEPAKLNTIQALLDRTCKITYNNRETTYGTK